MVRNNKLEIFENFQIDRNLPKYTKGKEVELTGSIINAGSNGIVITSSSGTNSAIIGGSDPWGSVIVRDGNSGKEEVKKESWWSKFMKKKAEVNAAKKQTMTIVNFFTSLAQSLNDLKVLQDTAIHYEAAISTAAKAGQTALMERLRSRLESAKSEIQLVVAGLNKYFTEDQIVDFYKKAKSDQNLKLTWIKNFVKPIPSKILEAKEKLDEQFVFDNYVILHYDPNNNATDLTVVEKEEVERRKKDPILFGVISGSRRLYYVGDWIDDYCDLTLDVVVETLREKVNTINNDKVKTYLDTGLREEVREKLPDPDTFSAYTYQVPTFFEKVTEKAGNVVEEIKKRVSRKKQPKAPAKTKKQIKTKGVVVKKKK